MRIPQSRHRGIVAGRLFSVVIVLALLIAACGGSDDGEPGADATATEPSATSTPEESSATPTGSSAGDEVSSDKPRVEPDVSDADLEALVGGFNSFAFDLYQAVIAQEDGNLIYSPTSIELAFSMVYAGARSETEAQMADVLGFLPQEQQHLAANALDQHLASLGEDAPPPGEQQGEPFQLNIANAVWGQEGFPFEQAFLDTLAEHYGAGMRIVDFIADAEAALQAVNAWVEERTQGRIKDLVPPDVITAKTRLVLANAIYFYGAWQVPFDADNTSDGAFTLLDGSEVTTPMMHQGSARIPYADADGYQVGFLPYADGTVEMAVILPDEGRFEEIEAGLSAEFIEQARAETETHDVALSMPKFDFESQLDLAVLLQEMGLTAPFTNADFSGIAQGSDLSISAAIHKATIAVDEEGTEATAATVIVVDESGAMGAELTLGRPFIFAIVERETGAILFLGRAINPVG